MNEQKEMNITQQNVERLLRVASLFVSIVGTSPVEIRVSLPKLLVEEVLKESGDFILKTTYLSETELEVDAMLSKLIITII